MRQFTLNASEKVLVPASGYKLPPSDLKKLMTPLDQLLADLGEVAQGIANQAMVDRGARLLDQLAMEHPMVHSLITGLMEKDPQAICDVLGLINPEVERHRKNKSVHDYLERVKEALRELQEDHDGGARAGRR